MWPGHATYKGAPVRGELQVYIFSSLAMNSSRFTIISRTFNKVKGLFEAIRWAVTRVERNHSEFYTRQ